MYWFTCVDDSDQFFDLLKVAIYSVKKNTDLIPIVLCAGTSVSKRSILNSLGIKYVSVEVDEDIYFAKHFPGAICRLYIPNVAHDLGIYETILYTDVDVLFISNPPRIKTPEVTASSYYPNVRPHNTVPISECGHWLEMFGGGGACLNSGVMYLNPIKLMETKAEFLNICNRPTMNNSPAESVYHYYNINAMSYTLNYFAYWNNIWAGCDVRSLVKPIIIHYHALKPNVTTHPVEVMQYYTDEYESNRRIWLQYREKSLRHCMEWYN